MSFRNTFITDFIYQGSAETKSANPLLEDIFAEYASDLSHAVNERGYGYYSGWMKTLDGSLEEMGLSEMVSKLNRATKVSFRLTILVESGAQLTYNIIPFRK